MNDWRYQVVDWHTDRPQTGFVGLDECIDQIRWLRMIDRSFRAHLRTELDALIAALGY